MAERKGAGHRAPEINTEGTGRAVPAVITAFLTEPFELYGAQTAAEAKRAVLIGARFDFHLSDGKASEVRTTFKPSRHFLTEDQREEPGRRVPHLDGIAFGAAFLEVTRREEGGDRDPDGRRAHRQGVAFFQGGEGQE